MDTFINGERPEEAAARRRASNTRTDSERLVEIMNRTATTFEAERVRLRLDREQHAREHAEVTAVEQNVRAELEAARAATPKEGIVMPTSEPVPFIDPIAIVTTGEVKTVSF
jgi:hypothetical protein